MCELTTKVISSVQNALLTIKQWDANATQLMENMKEDVARADEEVKQKYEINLTFNNQGAKNDNK